MLKRYWIYIVITLIAIASFWLIKSETKSSITEDNKFEIENPSSITKIFLADRNGNTVTLTKGKNNWLVNNQFDVRNDAITTLLSTANKIRIKKPVSKAAFENVIRFMATSGVYVEFFQNEEMIKSYTIGSNTPDHLGTYMLLNGSEKPFILHIPHFNGFLSPRYGVQTNAIDINNWRSNTVFNLPPNAIKSIKYTNYLDLESSYLLKQDPMQLINAQNQSVPFNNKKVLELLSSFKNLNCETYKKNKTKIDSANQLEELIINSDTLRTYRLSSKEEKDKEVNFTVNRKYATLNNGDLMLIQDYVFNKVLINITELIE